MLIGTSDKSSIRKTSLWVSGEKAEQGKTADATAVCSCLWSMAVSEETSYGDEHDLNVKKWGTKSLGAAVG